MTIYLKFPDQSMFNSACSAAGITPAAEITLPGASSLSVIGIIYDVDDTDPDNPIYTPKTGWHVNALGTLPDGWDAYAVTPDPATPARTFGG